MTAGYEDVKLLLLTLPGKWRSVDDAPMAQSFVDTAQQLDYEIPVERLLPRRCYTHVAADIVSEKTLASFSNEIFSVEPRLIE